MAQIITAAPSVNKTFEAGSTINKGDIIFANGREWICKKDDGSCATTTPSKDNKEIWRKKPRAKPKERRTTEATSSYTECLPWTMNYLWEEGELACGDDGNQYSCGAGAEKFCRFVNPTRTRMNTLANAAAGVTIWNSSGTAVEKEEFATGDDCIKWEEGKDFKFQTGDLVCDGAVWECLNYQTCATTPPGTIGSDKVWANKTSEDTSGDFNIPPSEEKTFDEWEVSKNYNTGDFAESTDGSIYKCIDSTACTDLPPSDEYTDTWTKSRLQPLPEDYRCGPWSGEWQYTEGDRVCQKNSDGTFSVYECAKYPLDQYCSRSDPATAIKSGEEYWVKLEKPPPSDAETYVRPIPYFVWSQAIMPYFITGDIVQASDKTFWKCEGGVACRTDMWDVSPTWVTVSDLNDGTLLGEERTMRADIPTLDCIQWASGATFGLKEVTCDAAGNLYACAMEGDNCSITDPTNDPDGVWFLRRAQGELVTTIISEDFYKWQFGAKYAIRDIVNMNGFLYECDYPMPNSLKCPYVEPGKPTLADGTPSPWKMLKARPGEPLQWVPEKAECTPWKFAELAGGFFNYEQQELACYKDRVLECVDTADNCNSVSPIAARTATDTEVWRLTRKDAVPVEPIPPPIIKAKPYDAWVQLVVPKDILALQIRDPSGASVIHVVECVNTGCATTDVEAQITAGEEVSGGWKEIDITDAIVEIDNITPRPMTQTCYDWLEVTADDFEIPFEYDYKMAACDVNRVWFCEDANMCMNVQPSLQHETATTTGVRVWHLTRAIPAPETPEIVKRVECGQFVQEYPYLLGDVVCTQLGQEIWQCIDPFKCPLIFPSWNINAADNPWIPVEGEPIKVENLVPRKVDCQDFRESYSIDRVIEEGQTMCMKFQVAVKFDFTTGEYEYASTNRAFKCDDAELCNKVKPADEDFEPQPWILLRAYGNYVSAPEPQPVQEPLQRCYKDDLKFKGKWAQDIQLKGSPGVDVSIENGFPCTDDVQLQRWIRAHTVVEPKNYKQLQFEKYLYDEAQKVIDDATFDESKTTVRRLQTTDTTTKEIKECDPRIDSTCEIVKEEEFIKCDPNVDANCEAVFEKEFTEEEKDMVDRTENLENVYSLVSEIEIEELWKNVIREADQAERDEAELVRDPTLFEPEEKERIWGFDFKGALAMFPAFCNDPTPNSNETPRQACRRELIAFFLYLLRAEKADGKPLDPPATDIDQLINRVGRTRTDFVCFTKEREGLKDPACQFHNTDADVELFYPANPNQFYYARGFGPEPLQGNQDYGEFSKKVFGDKLVLLNDPNRVLRDNRLTLAVALYRWFEPRLGHISFHEAIHANWEALDDAALTTLRNAGITKDAKISFVWALYRQADVCTVEQTWIDLAQQINKLLDPEAGPLDMVDISCEMIKKAIFDVGQNFKALPIYYNPNPNDSTACMLNKRASDSSTLEFRADVRGDYKRCSSYQQRTATATPQDIYTAYAYTGQYCVPFYVPGYPYLDGDKICVPRPADVDLASYTPQVWICENGFQCGRTDPTLKIATNPWMIIDAKARRTLPDPVREVGCFPFKGIVEGVFDTATAAFLITDSDQPPKRVCDAGRVWKCILNANGVCDAIQGTAPVRPSENTKGQWELVQRRVVPFKPDLKDSDDKLDGYICIPALNPYDFGTSSTGISNEELIQKWFDLPFFYRRDGSICVEETRFQLAITLFESKRDQAPVTATTERSRNAELIDKLLPQTLWDQMFPMAVKNAATSPQLRELFLRAVQEFPAFCLGKPGKLAIDVDPETLCKRELAAFFAHVIAETNANQPQTVTDSSGVTTTNPPPEKQGLANFVSQDCVVTTTTKGISDDCKFYPSAVGDKDDFMLRWTDVQFSPMGYYPRGALMTSGAHNYYLWGRNSYDFSEPDMAGNTESTKPWTLALMEWMVPYWQKPSPHQIMYGTWFPSEDEVRVGLEPGFGATIAVRKIETECGIESKKAKVRTDAYFMLMKGFGVDPAKFEDVSDCKQVTQGPYPANKWDFGTYLTANPTDPSGSVTTTIVGKCGRETVVDGFRSKWSLWDDNGYLECAEDSLA